MNNKWSKIEIIPLDTPPDSFSIEREKSRFDLVALDCFGIRLEPLEPLEDWLARLMAASEG